MAEERMPHGYTNATRREAGVVTKRYLGPDASARQHAEVIALVGLAGTLPVPALATPTALGRAGEGAVLVHGVFGPQNLLLDESTFEVTAIVDWEFAHLGHGVVDLARAEWIVRTHHPHHPLLVVALPSLLDGYGAEPE